MNKKNLSVALAMLGIAAKAFAAVETSDSGIVPSAFLVGGGAPSGGQASTAGVINLYVPKFFGPGTLLTVAYTLDVWTYATYNVNNYNGVATVHTVTWQLDNASLTLPNAVSVSPITSPLYSSPLGSLAPAANASGTTSAEQYTTPSAFTSPLATYEGAGNVLFVFAPSATSGVNGSPGNANPDVFVAARLNVEYTYTNEVPEPSTYAAGVVVLAGAGLVLRRRMQAAK